MIEITLTLNNYDKNTESYKECKTTYKLDAENPLPYLTTDNCLDIINACVELGFSVLDRDIENMVEQIHEEYEYEDDSDTMQLLENKVKKLGKEYFIRNTNLITFCNNINYIIANVYGDRLDKIEKRKVHCKYPIMLLCEDDGTSFKKCRSAIYPDNMQMYDIINGIYKMYEDTIKYLIGCDYNTTDIKEIVNDSIDEIKHQLNKKLDSWFV